jgi:hypothetical protein
MDSWKIMPGKEAQAGLLSFVALLLLGEGLVAAAGSIPGIFTTWNIAIISLMSNRGKTVLQMHACMHLIAFHYTQ